MAQIVVIGAAREVALGIVQDLIARGHQVVAVARDPLRLAEPVTECSDATLNTLAGKRWH